jgi:hypothetical protein
VICYSLSRANETRQPRDEPGILRFKAHDQRFLKIGPILTRPVLLFEPVSNFKLDHRSYKRLMPANHLAVQTLSVSTTKLRPALRGQQPPVTVGFTTHWNTSFINTSSLSGPCHWSSGNSGAPFRGAVSSRICGTIRCKIVMPVGVPTSPHLY